MLELRTIKAGMTNDSHMLVIDEKKYIVRIPGKGSENLLSRQSEFEAYEAINSLGISDEVLFLDPKNGYKISRFIQDARNCDPNNFDEVKLCLDKLKVLHTANLKVKAIFDPFERVEFYRDLCKNPKPQPDIFSLKRFLTPVEPRLCHIDANHDNFLFYQNNLKLIDWEYSAMSDPLVDVAMFAIYAMYNRDQVDKLIELYGTENKYRVYVYIAVCGLIWSNWCDYKAELGIDFGEYSTAQYRFANEYLEIFTKEWNKDV